MGTEKQPSVQRNAHPEEFILSMDDDMNVVLLWKSGTIFSALKTGSSTSILPIPDHPIFRPSVLP